MSPKNTIDSYLLFLILIAMSVSMSFALGNDNRNLLLIGVMCISPLIIVRYLEFGVIDMLLILFITVIVFAPWLNHPETMRWSTVMYSVMFCLTFMAYSRLLRHSGFSVEMYIHLLKWLIYAYTVVLLIQQFCVLIDLPVFNAGNLDPSEPWKLNSLMSEPAHSARIMGVLMYSFVVIKELITQRRYRLELDFTEDRWTWLSFLWVMLTMGSGSAFVFIFVVLSKFLKLKTVIPAVILMCGIIAATYFMEVRSAQRALTTFKATLTLNENEIMQADGSAAARIVPTLKLLKTVSILNNNGLFGHGIDQLSEDRVVDMSRIGYGKKGVTGGLLTVWYDYGFIAFILFVIFSLRCCLNRRDFFATFLLWISMILIFGINNQIVWLAIILLYTNNIFTKKLKTV